MTITGRRIDIRIVFNSIEIDDAKEVAKNSLDKFSDEEKKFYDFEFTIKQEKTDDQEGFLIMGSKNVNGIGLSWNNNNPITESEDE